jgi:hypothetical protein
VVSVECLGRVQILGANYYTFMHKTEYKDDGNGYSGPVLAWTVLVNREHCNLAVLRETTKKVASSLKWQLPPTYLICI